MPVLADAHLPIAHSASDANIVLSAMVPATSVLAVQPGPTPAWNSI